MNPTPSPSASESLTEITSLLTSLLPSSLSIKSFSGRWQTLRSKLASLKTLISQISNSPHYSHNPLLLSLLPNLLNTLRHTQSLASQCTHPTFPIGKLLMQSDLDILSSSLSSHIHHLHILLRSGVLHHSTAIVLLRPAPGCSDREALGFYIRDLFTRLQIGGIDYKKKALESLMQLIKDNIEGGGVVMNLVCEEGNVGYLVHLLEVLMIREEAVQVVLMLAEGGDFSRKCVFEEGALGPLLRIIDSGSLVGVKEQAIRAVEAITGDLDNGWGVTAYGGVGVLVEACKTGSVTAQFHAVGAMANVVLIEEVRVLLGEEGGVSVVVQLLDSGHLGFVKAAKCVAVLASCSECFRDLILEQGGLEKLLSLVEESLFCPGTVEHVLRAIYALSSSDSAIRLLSLSNGFIMQLAELIKSVNLVVQQLSVFLLVRLSSMSDGNKRAIAGCMGSLVNLMEVVKPVGLEEVAMQSLVSLLTVSSNRKDLARDETSIVRLVQMLDPKNEMISKKFPVAVISAIMAGGSHGCRKRLVAAGAYGHLQRLAEMEVPGAKKALQKFSGNRLISIFSRTWRE